MNKEEREKILERVRNRHATRPMAAAEPPSPESNPPARVVRTTGDVQVRVIDENNPPTEVRRVSRGGVQMRQSAPTGRGPMQMGAKVIDPAERAQTTRMRAGRQPGVYGANVVRDTTATEKPAGLGAALRTPMSAAHPPATGPMPPSGVPVTASPDLKAQIEAMGRSAHPGAGITTASVGIEDISIIMSQHARPETLQSQYQALLASGLHDYNLLCWINPAGQQLNDGLLQKIPHVKAWRDMGPWMRWTLVAAVGTEYTLVIDDDCLPGPQWLRLARERLESAPDDKLAVAAAGLIYNSDRFDAVTKIGFESLHVAEVDVDVGRGAWLMRTEDARAVLDYPRIGCPLSTPIHVAAALQYAGTSLVVLPYPHAKREAWGMLEEPKAKTSLSTRFDREAAAGHGPTSKQLRQLDYEVYRDAGWEPMCVMAAAAETARMDASELSAPEAAHEAVAPS